MLFQWNQRVYPNMIKKKISDKYHTIEAKDNKLKYKKSQKYESNNFDMKLIIWYTFYSKYRIHTANYKIRISNLIKSKKYSKALEYNLN